MVAVLVVVLLFLALGLAAARWGADTREGREWQPSDQPSAPALRHGRSATLTRAAWRGLRGFWAEQIELQQRLVLLARPWEEEYLHWSPDDGPRLHGTVVPPRHGRRYSTTASGWCPGRRTSALPDPGRSDPGVTCGPGCGPAGGRPRGARRP